MFLPLAKAIEHFDVVLAKKNQSLVKSPSVTIALSLMIPGFNVRIMTWIERVLHVNIYILGQCGFHSLRSCGFSGITRSNGRRNYDVREKPYLR